MRAQFCSARTNEVGDGAITCQRVFRPYRRKKAGPIGGANSIELVPGADRNLQTSIKQNDLVLRKESESALPVSGPRISAKKRDKSLDQCLVLKLKTGRCQVCFSQPNICARIQRVGAAIVNAIEFELSERVQRGEAWIEPGTIVVATPRGNLLIGDRVRQDLIDALSEPDRSDPDRVATSLVRIVEVRMKSNSWNRARKTCGTRGQQ